MTTIDQAIARLLKAKQLIGGDKVLIVSLTASGLEMTDKVTIVPVNIKESQYVEVRVGSFEGLEELFYRNPEEI